MGDTVTLDDSASDAVVAARSPSATTTARIEVGACVGRYTVRSLLGRGGMGEVYAAHDPALDRLVAIKVMHPGATSPEAQLRFLREAQVLARLNHPNVVAVHDVGAIANSTFVAMELVDGPTLAEWLGQQPRSVAEIVDVFLAAGRGLSAAHAAGITHRDFKPSNVMLGDRVRVVDFGLARPGTDGAEPTASTTARDANVTASGHAAGTPAYMAPEQADARWSPLSDQYSFAVALREAITGERTPNEKTARPLPAWLRPLVERATAAEPEARFPTMDELLAHVASGRHRTRRRLIGAGAVLGGALMIAAVAFRATSVDPCPRADAQFAGVWDEARRAELHAAFAKTGLPYAEKTWLQVATALDGFRESWLTVQNGTCRATRIEGRQSGALLDRQASCLERGRIRVRELTELWLSSMDAKTLETAYSALTSLPDSARCAAEQGLDDAPLPNDAVAVAEIAATRTRIDRAWAHLIAGQVKLARAVVPDITAAADRLGWGLLRAEALYLAGYIANALRLPEAESNLLAANQLALDAHADALAASAQIQLVRYLARTDRPDRALLAADLAEASLARAGGNDSERVVLLGSRGAANQSLGKLTDAKRDLQEAYDLSVRAFGRESARTWVSLNRLSGLANAAGEIREARRFAEQSLAGMIAALGEQHPAVASALNELATAAYQAGDLDTAVTYFERALAIVVTTTGATSQAAAAVLNNIGSMEVQRGNLDRAAELLGRAIEIRERGLGPDDPRVGDAVANLTQVFQARGDYARAAELARRALAIAMKAYGPDHVDVAQALGALALAMYGTGDVEGSVKHLRRAVDIRIRAQGERHLDTLAAMVQLGAGLQELQRCRESLELLAIAVPALEQAGTDPSMALEIRGQCELATNQPAKALATGRAALAACRAAGPANFECASKPWLVARALDAVGQRAEAITSAVEAELLLRQAASKGVEVTAELSAVRAWLAAHRK